jgi:hypothetical protein
MQQRSATVAQSHSFRFLNYYQHPYGAITPQYLMYEDKSISICTRVLMFCGMVVLLTARACQQMAPLSPPVESFSIITQFSFALWRNEMALHLHQGRTACHDPFFCGLKVYQELKSIEDFQDNMGAVLYHSEVYTNDQTSVKDKERAGHPSTTITDSNVEDTRAMIQEN